MEFPAIIETERLILREMTDDDIGSLRSMLQDPDVMYAYEHDFTEDDVKEWLERQKDRYARYGFGLWAMILKFSGLMIGQAGLTMQKYRNSEVLEIGYMLAKNYWHSGYAREAAEACKKYAFSRIGAREVFSIIKTDNAASIRVAESIGMKRRDEFMARYYNGDVPHYLYGVSSSDDVI